jgi:aldehyde dehydrogenase (NAD+)
MKEGTPMSNRVSTLLQALHLNERNLGTCTGPEWIQTTGAWIPSYDPATGDVIAYVQEADDAAYEKTVHAAQQAFATWRMVPAPKRGDMIRDLGNLLREYKEPLGELVSLEMGKIRAEGLGEVQEMIDICDFAVGLSRQLYGLTMHSERPQHRMYEQWHPLGPVGIITAFNFPVAVWSWNAAIAAVCGDTNIWKPSELVPLTAIAVQHLANRVMQKHGITGVFTLAVGSGAVVGQKMSEDHRIPLVSFTGSTRTGRKVAQTVAGRFGKSILELGGNNAIIVTANADLDMTVRAVLFGAVGTAGQRCTTTRRLIVHESIVDALCQRLTKAYASVPIGNPLDAGTLVGPLVNEKAVQSMLEAIARATTGGSRVLVGGKARPDIGKNYVEPTIIRMPQQLDVVCEETFAPILYIMSYTHIDEAIAMHNDVAQGLSSAIFTDSMREAEQFLSHAGSDCGIANVNIGTSGAEIGGAFGGEKETGGGRESGSDAWKAYMRRQTNTINWGKSLPLAQGIQFGD